MLPSFKDICKPNPGPGLLVLFEGADGCGKSKIVQRVRGRGLKTRWSDVIVTEREPGSGVPDELDAIWKGMLTSGRAMEHPELFQVYGLAECLEPQVRFHHDALMAGKLVLADRGFPSFVCYGQATGCSKEWLSQLAAPLYYPDLVFVFLRRHIQGDDAYERDDEFQARVRGHYWELLQQERWWEVPRLSEDDTVVWAANRIREAMQYKGRRG